MGRETDGGNRRSRDRQFRPALFPSVPISYCVLSVCFLVAAADMTVNVVPGLLESGRAAENVTLLQLDEEMTLPAWLSSSLSVACAIAFFAIYSHARAARLAWSGFRLVFAAAFAFLSLDETLMTHDRMKRRVGRLLIVLEESMEMTGLVLLPGTLLGVPESGVESSFSARADAGLVIRDPLELRSRAAAERRTVAGTFPDAKPQTNRGASER